MKKGAITFLLVLFFLSIVSAQNQILGGEEGFSPGEDIELIQVCSNCTYVNVTSVFLGNGSILKIFSQMTKDDTFYNYTLSGDYTDPVGEYIVSWKADNDGIEESGSYKFYIRKGGLLLTTGQAILYFIIILISLILAIFFIYEASVIPWTDKKSDSGLISQIVPGKYLKLLSFWFADGSILLFLGVLSGIINNLLYLETFNSLVTNIYIVAYYLSLGITILILSMFFIMIWIDLFIPLVKSLLMKNENRKRRIRV